MSSWLCCSAILAARVASRRPRKSSRRSATRASDRGAAAVYVDHRAFRTDRARRRSDLDAPALADARRDGLHVLDHPGGISGGPGDRQRAWDRSSRAAASGRDWRSACCQIAACRGDRLDRVAGRAHSALLARQSAFARQSLAQVPAGLRTLRCWRCCPRRCLWGASFPLALAAVAAQGRDPGRMVGRVYAANTVGAILGAIGFSLLLIPAIGTQHSPAPADRAGRRCGRCAPSRPGASRLRWPWCSPPACWPGACPRVPWGVVAYGRQLPREETARQSALPGRGHELLDRRHRAVQDAHVPRQRQSRGVERAAGHARASGCSGTSRPCCTRDAALGAGGRLRRGRHRRLVRRASGDRAHRDLRDRAADPAGRGPLSSPTRTTT